MKVSTKEELKQAVKALEPEIVVTDEALARTVRVQMTIRTVANIAVFVILAAALLMLADPGGWFKGLTWAQLVRQIMLAVGIILLFADYLMPAARVYKVDSEDANGLKLVPRRPK